MKRLVISLMLVLSVQLVTGQVKVAPQVDVIDLQQVIVDAVTSVDVNSILNAELDEAFNFDFSINWKDKTWDESKYVQDEQEIEIPLTKPGERGVLKIESHRGSIAVTGYDGKTVKLKMIKYSKKVDQSESRNGMKLVSSGGFNVEAQEYNNTVKIENEGHSNRVDFEVMVPKNFDIKASTYNGGKLTISGINGEIDGENYNGPIEMTNISGVASATTYNGDVVVTFSEVTSNKPMTFSTYNGKVDITFPGSIKATAKMKTSRDIYTDFENFDLQEVAPVRETNKDSKGTRLKYESWVSGKINGGGAEIAMETRNGNIYIKKGS